jgi:hypothetical protein
MTRILFYFIIVLLISCKSSPTSTYEEVDLLSYGMPISVLAPPGSEVKKEDLGPIQSIIVKGEQYNVQIYSSNSQTIDPVKVKKQALEDAKTGRYFSKIIEEEEHGFIFEKDIDGTIIYDFRYVKVMGDKEYIFQKGLMGTYTEEEVRAMYASVQ